MTPHCRRALVTGATGFIGTHLVSRLLAEGWDVEIVVRPRGYAPKQGPIVRIHEYDGHIESLVSAVAESQPDVVFHLASAFLASHAPAQVEPMLESNILFGTQLLEAMSLRGVTRLVNVGSYWQHYQNSEYDPVCLYAATKQAFEAILTFFVNARNLSAITLKLFDTYGPNDPRPKLVQYLHTAAVEKKRLEMSPGEQCLSLVYIDDVIEAFLMAADRLLSGAVMGSEVYTAGADQPTRLRDLVDMFGKVTGKPIDVEWGAQPYRARQMMTPWTRGVRLPGWKPMVSLEEGLRRLHSARSDPHSYMVGLGSLPAQPDVVQG
jgi:nucleoside-diphosphate-sugar epimerase